MDSRIKAKLQEIVSKEAARLSQNTVSIRNDRYVIPVKAEYKNMIKGTIQDVSASNQTFYIEPIAIMELTNEKQKLIKEEVKEIYKKPFINQDYHGTDTHHQDHRRHQGETRRNPHRVPRH